ncbi:MAG: hypothetical protein WC476_05885 [Phycisphaerae bacterium]|jgi:glucan phosphoethanolaminetransferase (alkaline phosphatase superfamily)
MLSCAEAQSGSEMAPVFALVFTFLVVVIVLVAIAIKLIICCKIFSKAGYSWALGLLMLVPIANIIMAFYLAFADWPVRKELRELKQKQDNAVG